MAQRKWKDTKQQPGTAGPGNMLGCCLISFHFMWAILSTSTVHPWTLQPRHTVCIYLNSNVSSCLKGKIPPFTVESLFASLPFIVPSLIYVVSNNAYFYGLTLVAPPIWLILVSMKTFVSAVTYKFILRRPISDAQLGGSMLMVLSVAIAKFPDALSARHSETMVNALPVSAIFLASFACIVSGKYRFPYENMINF